MAKFLLRIKLQVLCKLIVLTLLNKFDFFLCIEGNTGTGKSTLAIHIARGVKAEFKRLYDLKPETVEYYYERVIKQQQITIEKFVTMLLELKEKKAYMYNPYRDLIYNKKAMIDGLVSWKRIIIADEMIGISFNRDFQTEDQKKIIKLINMNRDHCNLIIASVPQFQNLDVQIKNMTKMRISVARRGAGILQTKNKTIYAKDRWDSANNEKIEREWLIKGGKPKYTRLTTARGLIHFPPLCRRVEEEYQKIKNDKRSNIVEVEMGITKEVEKKDPKDLIYDLIINRKVRSRVQFDGMCIAHGLDPETIRSALTRKIQKNCVGTSITEFYWDKKAKNEVNDDAFTSLIGQKFA